MLEYAAAVALGLLVLLGMYLGWYWLWLPAAVWFSLRYQPIWLIGLAVLVDGYYGAFTQVPVLTILIIPVILGSWWLRPRLQRSV